MVFLRVAIRLRLHDTRSLKDRRVIVQSVRRRLRNRFNVAVAEIGPADQWREVELGLALVGSDRAVVDSELEAITRFLDRDVRFEMVDRQVESY
jgi:uncharacterized protein YlxP (DUF503 family)